MKPRTLRKNKRTIRRTIRKLYVGGFRHQQVKCNGANTEEYLALVPYIQPPYQWCIKPYGKRASCDMYIWDIKEKSQNPHIHIHGFSSEDGYAYTISAKNQRNILSKLYSKFDHGYESALTQMYNSLNDTKLRLSALTTPTKNISPDLPQLPYKIKSSEKVSLKGNKKNLESMFETVASHSIETE